MWIGQRIIQTQCIVFQIFLKVGFGGSMKAKGVQTKIAGESGGAKKKEDGGIKKNSFFIQRKVPASVYRFTSSEPKVSCPSMRSLLFFIL